MGGEPYQEVLGTQFADSASALHEAADWLHLVAHELDEFAEAARAQFPWNRQWDDAAAHSALQAVYRHLNGIDEATAMVRRSVPLARDAADGAQRAGPELAALANQARKYGLVKVEERTFVRHTSQKVERTFRTETAIEKLVARTQGSS